MFEVEFSHMLTKASAIETSIESLSAGQIPDSFDPALTEQSVMDLKHAVDSLLDSSNFNVSLSNILGILSPALEAISEELCTLEQFFEPLGYDRPEYTPSPPPVQNAPKSSNSNPASINTEDDTLGLSEEMQKVSLSETPVKNDANSNQPDSATPTFESLGLSKTAMEIFGNGAQFKTPTGRTSSYSSNSMLTPQLRTITKKGPMRDSFSSIDSPHLKTIIDRRSSETICKSVSLITPSEFERLDDFVSGQFDLEELNEGVELVNDLLTDKQLRYFGDPDSSSISVQELSQLGIGARHKALLLALLQLKRLAMAGYDANGSKKYEIV